MELSPWQHPTRGEWRYYVNGWWEVLGLEVERYKSGNICYASLNGERISNRQARNMLEGKVWFDSEGKMHTKPTSNFVHYPTEEQVKARLREEGKSSHLHIISPLVVDHADLRVWDCGSTWSVRGSDGILQALISKEAFPTVEEVVANYREPT